jgi:serine/threonine-protein kinase RsbW
MSTYRPGIEGGILKAVFSADLVNVDRFCEDASRKLKMWNLQRFEFAVQILLREGLNNAVIHGSKSDDGKTVEAVFFVQDRHIFIEIADQGPGFPWREVMKEAKNDQASSGRGFQIFQAYSESFYFNDRGNHLTIMLSIAS